MNVLDLFSGIGGFSLGLQRAGMRTVAFCEIDPYCQRVLKKHWPYVPCYGDIRTLTAARLAADGIIPPLAHSKHNGSSSIEQFGEQKEKGRMLQSQRCRYCTDFFSRFSCNSPDECDCPKCQGFCECGRIQSTGIDAICGGFPCQDISTAGKGAGIGGERSGLWSEYARIVGEVRPKYVLVENVAALLGRGIERVLGDLAALGFDCEWHCIPASAVGAPHRRDRVWIVAHANVGRQQACDQGGRRLSVADADGDVAHAGSPDVEGQRLSVRISEERNSFSGSSWWLTEPDVGRVAHGVPARVDRLRALGNAVVPQIPEIIGRAIMSAQP